MIFAIDSHHDQIRAELVKHLAAHAARRNTVLGGDHDGIKVLHAFADGLEISFRETRGPGGFVFPYFADADPGVELGTSTQIGISLGVVASILTIAVVASLLRPHRNTGAVQTQTRSPQIFRKEEALG